MFGEGELGLFPSSGFFGFELSGCLFRGFCVFGVFGFGVGFGEGEFGLLAPGLFGFGLSGCLLPGFCVFGFGAVWSLGVFGLPGLFEFAALGLLGCGDCWAVGRAALLGRLAIANAPIARIAAE